MPDPDNDRYYNVVIELPNGKDSAEFYKKGVRGDFTPQRLVLHELIVQAVTERNFNFGSEKYEDNLVRKLEEAKNLSSFQALEQAGNSDPKEISAVLDALGLKHLPLHKKAKQIMMVTGGAGTGKTKIAEELSSMKSEAYKTAAQINPDHYKNLLAPIAKWQAMHGTYTHSESSMIADKIIDRIQNAMDQRLPAPHVLMDVSTPHGNYMKFAKRFKNLTVYTGTLSPDKALKRAYERGHNLDGSIRLKGRVTPSKVVLGSAKTSSEMMPNIFKHRNLQFTMFSTDVSRDEQPTRIAKWDNHERRLEISDPDRFIDFVERQNINITAKNASELYKGVNRTPASLADNLSRYIVDP